MANETLLTLVGNLVDDPELRFTPSGAAVANFRIASTPRTFDKQSGEWRDGETLFLTCNVWRQAAENVAESLGKGMRVVVQGRLKQRSFETRDGDKRTVYEVDVDEVGPSLRSATAKVSKVSREQRPDWPREQAQGGVQRSRGVDADDPWARPPEPAGQAAQQRSFDDEPPF